MKGGQKYVIDLMSKQFDPFLRIEDARGKQLVNGGFGMFELAVRPEP